MKGISMVKVALLAGGLGTRLSDEMESRPKPMLRVGEYPILWHMMKYFFCFYFSDFFVATGYKGEIIKNDFCSCHTFFDSILWCEIKTAYAETSRLQSTEYSMSIFSGFPVFLF